MKFRLKTVQEFYRPHEKEHVEWLESLGFTIEEIEDSDCYKWRNLEQFEGIEVEVNTLEELMEYGTVVIYQFKRDKLPRLEIYDGYRE